MRILPESIEPKLLAALAHHVTQFDAALHPVELGLRRRDACDTSIDAELSVGYSVYALRPRLPVDSR